MASCRAFENGLVPWTAIKIYADEFEIEGDKRDMLYEIIRLIDVWYMDRQADKIAKDTAKQNRKTGKKKNG